MSQNLHETVKAKTRPTVPYLTTEEDRKNNTTTNTNPFVPGTTFWQSFMANWYNTYGEFFRSANKMTEFWYNTYWKPWLQWQQQMQQKDKDKVNVE